MFAEYSPDTETEYLSKNIRFQYPGKIQRTFGEYSNRRAPKAHSVNICANIPVIFLEYFTATWPVSDIKFKRDKCATWLFLNINFWTNISMKIRPRRELSINMVIDSFLLKTSQLAFFPCFTFTPKTGSLWDYLKQFFILFTLCIRHHNDHDRFNHLSYESNGFAYKCIWARSDRDGE